MYTATINHFWLGLTFGRRANLFENTCVLVGAVLKSKLIFWISACEDNSMAEEVDDRIAAGNTS